MKRIVCIVILMTAAVAAETAWAGSLTIFSGAGLMKPMEELRRNFESARGITVDVHYGNSGELFGMLGAGRPCDVLVPGAEKYTADALKKGWVKKDSITPLVRHVPVIAVPKGNPGNITCLADLSRNGVRLAAGDPKAPAIGRVFKKMLKDQGLWEAVSPNIKVLAPTVNQLLIYVTLNQVDAAVIWEDLGSWSEAAGRLELVSIDPGKNIIKTVPTAVCTRSLNPGLALAFNTYIASSQGMDIWKKWGFEPCTP